MKYFIILTLISSIVSCQAKEENKQVTSTSSVESMAQKEGKVKLPGEKEEDCDEKAKKPIEIKPESISLGGNTGCSLDEAKP